MQKQHHYSAKITWTGNCGSGTDSYASYERNFCVEIKNKPPILGSSDPAFRGDNTRYNPEDLLVTSLSSCHMLWYLHLCSQEGIIVTHYTDEATGTMIETSDGSGRFSDVTLHPIVHVKDASMINQAVSLHQQANELCFIAKSVNFHVKHKPVIKVNETHEQ